MRCCCFVNAVIHLMIRAHTYIRFKKFTADYISESSGKYLYDPKKPFLHHWRDPIYATSSALAQLRKKACACPAGGESSEGEKASEFAKTAAESVVLSANMWAPSADESTEMLAREFGIGRAGAKAPALGVSPSRIPSVAPAPARAPSPPLPIPGLPSLSY
jgi:hypothetical protein